MPQAKNRPVTRGIDHIGITVPDLEAASKFLVEAFDAVPLYDNIERDGPQKGRDSEATLLLHPGTVVAKMRMLSIGTGPGIELFEMHGPDQRDPARTSDFGLQHFAVYVDDIDAACARFVKAGGTMAPGPNEMLGLEKGPNNAFRYARAPWGTVIELLSTPSPETYEQDTDLRRWKPPVSG